LLSFLMIFFTRPTGPLANVRCRLQRCLPVAGRSGRPANIRGRLQRRPPVSRRSGRPANIRGTLQRRPPVAGRTGRPSKTESSRAMCHPGTLEVPASQIAGMPKRFLCCLLTRPSAIAPSVPVLSLSPGLAVIGFV
jgi:hypothetical protein